MHNTPIQNTYSVATFASIDTQNYTNNIENLPPHADGLIAKTWSANDVRDSPRENTITTFIF